MHSSDPKGIMIVAGAVILLGAVVFVWLGNRAADGSTFSEALRNNFVTEVFAKHNDLLKNIGIPIKH